MFIMVYGVNLQFFSGAIGYHKNSPHQKSFLGIRKISAVFLPINTDHKNWHKPWHSAAVNKGTALLMQQEGSALDRGLRGGAMGCIVGWLGGVGSLMMDNTEDNEVSALWL